MSGPSDVAWLPPSYINAHAEELRALFVAQKGQKEVKVYAYGSLQTIDMGMVAVALTKEMERHLLDPGLHDWIMPNFTTTTTTDTMTAAILMMGSMQKYFSFSAMISCGIFSVTLLGEKADWVEIRRRLDKLSDFGKEPEHFSRLLSPILDYFIRSFDSADDPEVVDFWSKIAHKSGGSGPSYLSGWITAFCFWNSQGQSIYGELQSGDNFYSKEKWGCNLDGTLYHRLDTEDIPEGCTSVPVFVDDNEKKYNTQMVAGSVGIALSSSGQKLENIRNYSRGGNQDTEVVGDGTGLDSLQLVVGWWMYELREG